MESILANTLDIFNKHSGWIVWNLFLAFIPLVLSVWLFRWHRHIRSRSLIWWLGFICYFAFLPNAPYLLTDIIHLIGAIRANYSIWIITLVFFPLHLSAIALGGEAYVISLINQSYYLKRIGYKKYIFWTELLTHFLSAIGIYLGRFLRFNSWDIITQPNVLFTSSIDNLTQRVPVLVIFVTFAILTVFYLLMKQVTLGIMLRLRQIIIENDHFRLKD
ncbi:protein of unknown function DUF1361 [Stanieria cyanosphaera PCC 7437]|uniref:DUF1361 domain-containing protein n=1 Tax=Stanieria cyanosphaera (strain ATCC 29371 / PCC 7437) TaxID=111780 RepID=K9XWH6_STAC7|nr:DUF1361 domain-containing protein [Stanieria cyanosphaera]AFZ36945.1 protein of unknown function DUF1361 [Stanieria cyanosphaera PCC 7437]